MMPRPMGALERIGVGQPIRAAILAGHDGPAVSIARRECHDYERKILTMDAALDHLSALSGRGRARIARLLRRELGLSSGDWRAWRCDGVPAGRPRGDAWLATERLERWFRAERHFDAAGCHRLRARLGWTRVKFAARLHIHPGLPARWECGEARPTRAHLSRLTTLAKLVASRPVGLEEPPGDWPAQAIHDLRIRLGWTQRGMAARLGRSNISISNWECDVCVPSAASRAALDRLAASKAGEQGRICA